MGSFAPIVWLAAAGAELGATRATQQAASTLARNSHEAALQARPRHRSRFAHLLATRTRRAADTATKTNPSTLEAAIQRLGPQLPAAESKRLHFRSGREYRLRALIRVAQAFHARGGPCELLELPALPKLPKLPKLLELLISPSSRRTRSCVTSGADASGPLARKPHSRLGNMAASYVGRPRAGRPVTCTVAATGRERTSLSVCRKLVAWCRAANPHVSRAQSQRRRRRRLGSSSEQQRVFAPVNRMDGRTQADRWRPTTATSSLGYQVAGIPPTVRPAAHFYASLPPGSARLGSARRAIKCNEMQISGRSRVNQFGQEACRGGAPLIRPTSARLTWAAAVAAWQRARTLVSADSFLVSVPVSALQAGGLRAG